MELVIDRELMIRSIDSEVSRLERSLEDPHTKEVILDDEDIKYIKCKITHLTKERFTIISIFQHFENQVDENDK